jgi:hypothetical protein
VKGMPVPDDMVKMMAKPGKYAIPLDAAFIAYLMVEVDEQGKVHQLKPDGVTRDGVLNMDGWMVRKDFRVRVFSVRRRKDGRDVFIRVGHPNPPDPETL